MSSYCDSRLADSLFPRLEEESGPLGSAAQLLVQVLAMVPLANWLPGNRQGRPMKNRSALAAAFLAKSVYGLTTTRQLRARLQVEDQQMRRCCGWQHASQLPHEATFSRAFAEFARTELAQQLHAALIGKTQAARLIGHISRDSSAIHGVQFRLVASFHNRQNRLGPAHEITNCAYFSHSGQWKPNVNP